MKTRLNREKMIEALLESQQLAQRAIELCETSLLLREVGGSEGESPEDKEDCEKAADVCVRVARRISDEAKASAKDGEVELPPRLSEVLEQALSLASKKGA